MVGPVTPYDRKVPPPAAIPGARLLFSIDPAVSYLNHGSFGAVPIGVQRAQQRLRDEIEANPHKFYTQGMLDRVLHTRRHIASFLGADPDGSALVPNTTTAVSLVLASLRLGAADEVLLTDHGYGSVTMATRRQCRRAGATARTVALPLAASDAEVVSRVRAALRPGRTKLLIIDQIASSTSATLPVRELAAAAREHEIPVLVDAAHVPGMFPVDVSAIGADFWVGNLHKWAFAPRGTALFSVAPRWRDMIRPLVVSWEQESGFPARLEWQGTLDYTAWLAAPAGLYTLRSLGPDLVRGHNRALAAYGQAVVAAGLGVEAPASPAELAMRVVPLPPGYATDAGAARMLRQRIADDVGFEVAVNAYRGRGLLRLSAQVYNRADEYDRLAERLPGFLARI